MPTDNRAKGTLITLAGVLMFAPDALLVRLTAIDAATLVAGRDLLAGAIVLAWCSWASGGRLAHELASLSRWGLAVAVLQALNSILFIFSLQHTTVANALLVFSTAPLLTAVLAWTVLREGLPASTWAAIAASSVGLAVIVSGSIGAGHVLGDALALANALTVALSYIIIRRHRDVSMVPAMGLGLLMAAAVTAPFAGYPPMSSMQWLWLGIGGGVILPAALILLTIGPRYLPAPEVAMLSLMEAVLGPLLVWLVLAEHPGLRTIAGGGIIVLVLFLHSAVRLWSDREVEAKARAVEALAERHPIA